MEKKKSTKKGAQKQMKMAEWIARKVWVKNKGKGRVGKKKGVQNHIEKEAEEDTKMGIQSD